LPTPVSSFLCSGVGWGNASPALGDLIPAAPVPTAFPLSHADDTMIVIICVAGMLLRRYAVQYPAYLSDGFRPK